MYCPSVYLTQSIITLVIKFSSLHLQLTVLKPLVKFTNLPPPKLVPLIPLTKARMLTQGDDEARRLT